MNTQKFISNKTLSSIKNDNLMTPKITRISFHSKLSQKNINSPNYSKIKHQKNILSQSKFLEVCTNVDFINSLHIQRPMSQLIKRHNPQNQYKFEISMTDNEKKNKKVHQKGIDQLSKIFNYSEISLKPQYQAVVRQNQIDVDIHKKNYLINFGKQILEKPPSLRITKSPPQIQRGEYSQQKQIERIRQQGRLIIGPASPKQTRNILFQSPLSQQYMVLKNTSNKPLNQKKINFYKSKHSHFSLSKSIQNLQQKINGCESLSYQIQDTEVFS